MPKIRLTNLSILALGLCLSACQWLAKSPSGERPVPAIKKDNEEPPSVFVVQAEKQELYEPLVLAGIVQAKKQYSVLASVAGILSSAFVKEGERVRKGQLLFTIKPDSMGFEYKNHKIYAPIAGMLTNLSLSPGQKIAQYDQLAEIKEMAAIETTVDATYEDLNTLHTGLGVDVFLSPGTNWEMKTPGEVVHVSPAADEITHTFRTTVSIDCSSPSCQKILRLGTLAKIRAKQNIRIGFKLPSRFLHEQQSKLLIVKDGNIASWIPIETGKNYGEEVEITQGLTAGMLVVTSYSERPEEGEKVAIAHSEEPAEPIEDIARKISESPERS